MKGIASAPGRRVLPLLGSCLTLVSCTPQTLDPEASAPCPYSCPLSLFSALLIPQALKDSITLELWRKENRAEKKSKD